MKSTYTPADLTAVAHTQLALAAASYSRGRWFQSATLAAALIAMFLPRWAYFAAVAAFACQIATFHFRNQGQRRQGTGEEILRRAFLSDALGHFDQDIYMRELLNGVKDGIPAPTGSRPHEQYFASNSSGGLIRLRDHLMENMFWNQCLYKEAAKRASRILIALVGSAAAAYLLAVALIPSSATITLTRVFIAVIGFLIAYALFNDVQSWRSAALAIEKISLRVDTMKLLTEKDLRSKSFGELLTAFTEHTVATSKLAPIPDKVYQAHRDRLNALWDLHGIAANSVSRTAGN